jgi:hypothetical protein
MDDNDFSPQQSLELIESMINKAKDRFSENGHLYLVWGWVVLICSISEFVLWHFYHFAQYYLVWILTGVAMIYQIWYIRKRYKKQRVHTYTDNIVAFVWLTFLILGFLFCYLFGTLTSSEYYSHVNYLAIALYGMPTFLSGIILRFKPLVIGGIGCWILSVITVFIPGDYQVLSIPVAMILAWIIPGYMIKARFKSQ